MFTEYPPAAELCKGRDKITEAEEAEHVAAQEGAAQEEAEIGGGASGRQIWDQSRMFDPEFFLAYFQI